MKKNIYAFIIFGFLLLLGIAFAILFRTITPSNQEQQSTLIEFNQEGITMIQLPAPVKKGNISLEQTLQARRSVRQFSNKPLQASQISQLLWSAQGINNEEGFRTAPSAGATFPLEMFVLVNNVTDIRNGIYHYNPAKNTLSLVHTDDVGTRLVQASFSQSMLTEAGAVFIFGAVFERTTRVYQDRGIRYIYNEVGHASQNLHLQAAALNLGTVVVGAYRDDEVEAILNLDENIRVLYMMPVGHIH